MGKVYLGEEFFSDVHTHLKEVIVNKTVNILKKPASRYQVDEEGVVKTIEFDFTGAFDEITSINAHGLYSAFFECTGITGSVSFPKLTSIGTYGLYYAFQGCTGITGSVSFPELTTIESNGLDYAFQGCTGITELHFRADAQSVIESQNGYSTNFGATNATIYFDL